MLSFYNAGFQATRSNKHKADKKKEILVCGISVKREIKSVHCLVERYAWLSLKQNNGSLNKTVAKIKKTCCSYTTVAQEQKTDRIFGNYENRYLIPRKYLI